MELHVKEERLRRGIPEALPRIRHAGSWGPRAMRRSVPPNTFNVRRLSPLRSTARKSNRNQAVPGTDQFGVDTTPSVPNAARLIDVATPADPSGVAIVLHGGAARRRNTRVSPAQLSVLRMIPVAARIARASMCKLVVVRLLNEQRGWGIDHTPVNDVEWALGDVARRFGAGLPVCLVGHSLGGRAALLSAGQPQVHGVVALAPWVALTDSVEGAHGTSIVIIHGDADRVAIPGHSRRLAQALSRDTTVSYVSVSGGTHSMFRHMDAFDGLAARCVVWMLLGTVAGQTVRSIAAGEEWLEL
jgi:Alpha/beta hydrolase family